MIPFRQYKTKIECAPPICPELREILLKAPKTLRLDGYVVPRPIYVENLGRDFRVLCKRAGTEPYDKPLHTLRKSCIDDWARAGYPPKVVQLWAGHRDIKTTLTFYTRVDERDVQRAARESLFGKSDATDDATG